MNDIKLDRLDFPTRVEQVSDQTASGIISRLHYPDRTRIVKRARLPEDDKTLGHEYTTLMLLNIDGDAPKQIPRIFHELPAQGINRYAFEMEDISGKSLASNEGDRRFVDTLPDWRRVDALDEAVKGLSFANKKGILHGDVQSANIMYDPKAGAGGKVIDWVLAHRRDSSSNPLSDVIQFRDVAESTITGAERTPRKIEQWIYDVGKSKFSSPEEAWEGFRRAALHFNTDEDV